VYFSIIIDRRNIYVATSSFSFNYISIHMFLIGLILFRRISLGILLIISGITASLVADMSIFYQEQYCTERFFNKLVIIFRNKEIAESRAERAARE